jgi:hypothetical protein
MDEHNSDRFHRAWEILVREGGGGGGGGVVWHRPPEPKDEKLERIEKLEKQIEILNEKYELLLSSQSSIVPVKRRM